MIKSTVTRLIGIAAVGLFVIAAPATVQAGPIVVDSGWYGFCFTTPGPATAGCLNDASQTSGNAFTFTTATSVLLKVTDAFLEGDVFDVYDGAVFLFSTPIVAFGTGTTTDPDLAFADPLYSSGSILLGPGSYSINIFNTVGPISGGGAYMEVVTASVPEPVGFALLGGGLLVLALRRRFGR